MQRDAVCLTACFMDRIWNLSGFFIFIHVYDQILMSDVCQILICYKTKMMMMKCKHHESYITFRIEPNGQKWEQTSVQAH